jgi:hypothetical protein
MPRISLTFAEVVIDFAREIPRHVVPLSNLDPVPSKQKFSLLTLFVEEFT